MVLANYAFQSSNGNSTDTSTLSTAGTFGATGLTVTYATTPWTGGTTGVRANTTSMPTAQTTVNYFSFAITPNAGYNLNLSGTAALTFQYGRNTWGPGAVFSWQAWASTDNFATRTSLGTGSASTPECFEHRIAQYVYRLQRRWG